MSTPSNDPKRPPRLADRAAAGLVVALLPLALFLLACDVNQLTPKQQAEVCKSIQHGIGQVLTDLGVLAGIVGYEQPPWIMSPAMVGFNAVEVPGTHARIEGIHGGSSAGMEIEVCRESSGSATTWRTPLQGGDWAYEAELVRGENVFTARAVAGTQSGAWSNAVKVRSTMNPALLPAPPVPPPPSPAITQAYGGYDLIFVNTHSHTNLSDAKPSIHRKRINEDRKSDPNRVIEANLKSFDALILTDHGEHLNPAEWKTEEGLAGQFTTNSKACLRGFEISGSKRSHPVMYPHTNPGWGHLLVVGTTDFAGTEEWDNEDEPTENRGKPPQLLGSYPIFLEWLTTQPRGMAIFAHPNLYKIEKTFDGFAEANSLSAGAQRAVPQLVGCELCTHTVEGTPSPLYSGLGNGIDLRSSNEACYKTLLRRGWRIGAYAGGDEHDSIGIQGFGKEDTVTGMYVEKNRLGLSEGILEAMQQRRTFSTELHNASIMLSAQSGGASGIMGQNITVGGELTVEAHCQVPGGWCVKGVSLVCVSHKGRPGPPTDITYDYSNDLVRNSTDSKFTSLELASNEILLVYARAELSNGKHLKHLVSSPIWLKFP